MKRLCLTALLIALLGAACAQKALPGVGASAGFGAASVPSRDGDSDAPADVAPKDPSDAAADASSAGAVSRAEARAFDTTRSNPGTLGPVAESERIPVDVFAYTARYGDDFENIILPPPNIENPNPGFVISDDGTVTVPLKIEIWVDSGGGISSLADAGLVLLNGPQVRLVFEPQGEDPKVSSLYVDRITSLLVAPVLPNAYFEALPVANRAGELKVYVYNKSAYGGMARSDDYSEFLVPFGSMGARETFLSDADYLYIGSAKVTSNGILLLQKSDPRRTVPVLPAFQYEGQKAVQDAVKQHIFNPNAL